MDARRIAIVPTPGSLSLDEVAPVAAALQRQVTEDFAPWWGIDADVVALGALEDVPRGYFVVQLVRSIDQAGIEGFHYLNQIGEPHALVRVDHKHWSMAVSHECLEMVGDPSGNLTQAAPPPGETVGVVDYLQEVCDPCQHFNYGYELDGIAVSDFYGPNYFDTRAKAGEQYCITGKLKAPRTLLPGGYLCYRDATGNWYKRVRDGGRETTFQVGQPRDMAGVSYREWIDNHSRKVGHSAFLRDLGGKHREKKAKQENFLQHRYKERRRASKIRAKVYRAFVR
jgi:hypothetical protein